MIREERLLSPLISLYQISMVPEGSLSVPLTGYCLINNALASTPRRSGCRNICSVFVCERVLERVLVCPHGHFPPSILFSPKVMLSRKRNENILPFLPSSAHSFFFCHPSPQSSSHHIHRFSSSIPTNLPLINSSSRLIHLNTCITPRPTDQQHPNVHFDPDR